jgi:tetratricopeptide (TPR) repeat protein
MLRILALLLFPLLVITNLFGQASQTEIGNEYFLKGNYEKALIYYEKALKADADVPDFYENYFQSLMNLGETERAEKSLKKLKRRYPLVWPYTIDLLLVKKMLGREKEFHKEKKLFIDEIGGVKVWVEASARHLIKRKKFEFAEELFLKSRGKLREPTVYARNLIALYQFSGQKIKMIREGIGLLYYEPGYLNFIENTFQEYLIDPEVDKYLEEELINRLQKDPQSLVFSKLFIWFYVQKKQFKSAFLQARSMDKRLKLQGRELMDLGEIFDVNKAFEEAIQLYKYVADEYPESAFFPEAKRKEISAREELVKNSFPVDRIQIQIILAEYQQLVDKIGKKRTAAEAFRRMALLYAFQLSDYDKAISLLQDAILIPRTPRIFSGRCKLDMGDIYLLKGEPWESKLLYAQVEKSFKDQPIGHEGKFRLAKVYYYSGEFELAKANLDILKRATTRQIANDAMDLSLLIQDNSALDTSYDALILFAQWDLLFFSQKYLEAKEGFDGFLLSYPDHSLTDETLYKLAQIGDKVGNYKDAIGYLDRIILEYSQDILVDDALYLKGRILEEKIEDLDSAMETYKLILFDYPGSFYSEDARRRYRTLRGDQLN